MFAQAEQTALHAAYVLLAVQSSRHLKQIVLLIKTEKLQRKTDNYNSYNVLTRKLTIQLSSVVLQNTGGK